VKNKQPVTAAFLCEFTRRLYVSILLFKTGYPEHIFFRTISKYIE